MLTDRIMKTICLLLFSLAALSLEDPPRIEFVEKSNLPTKVPPPPINACTHLTHGVDGLHLLKLDNPAEQLFAHHAFGPDCRPVGLQKFPACKPIKRSFSKARICKISGLNPGEACDYEDCGSDFVNTTEIFFSDKDFFYLWNHVTTEESRRPDKYLCSHNQCYDNSALCSGDAAFCSNFACSATATHYCFTMYSLIKRNGEPISNYKKHLATVSYIVPKPKKENPLVTQAGNNFTVQSLVPGDLRVCGHNGCISALFPSGTTKFDLHDLLTSTGGLTLFIHTAAGTYNITLSHDRKPICGLNPSFFSWNAFRNYQCGYGWTVLLLVLSLGLGLLTSWGIYWLFKRYIPLPRISFRKAPTEDVELKPRPRRDSGSIMAGLMGASLIGQSAACGQGFYNQGSCALQNCTSAGRIAAIADSSICFTSQFGRINDTLEITVLDHIWTPKLEEEYITYEGTFQTEGLHHCFPMGNCHGSTCESNRVGKTTDWVHGTHLHGFGLSGCLDSCGSWSCGCLLFNPSCVFWTSIFRPSGTAIPVYRVQEWTREVEANVSWHGQSVKIRTSFGQPRSLFDGQVKITFESEASPSVNLPPFFYKTVKGWRWTEKISTRGSPVRGEIGEIQCKDRGTLSWSNCVMPDNILKCSANFHKPYCEYPTQDLFKLGRDIPVSWGTGILSVNSKPVFRIPSTPMTSYFIETKFPLSYLMSQSSCTITNVTLGGCFNCGPGAWLQLEATGYPCIVSLMSDIPTLNRGVVLLGRVVKIPFSCEARYLNRVIRYLSGSKEGEFQLAGHLEHHDISLNGTGFSSNGTLVTPSSGWGSIGDFFSSNAMGSLISFLTPNLLTVALITGAVFLLRR